MDWKCPNETSKVFKCDTTKRSHRIELHNNNEPVYEKTNCDSALGEKLKISNLAQL